MGVGWSLDNGCLVFGKIFRFRCIFWRFGMRGVRGFSSEERERRAFFFSLIRGFRGLVVLGSLY